MMGRSVKCDGTQKSVQEVQAIFSSLSCMGSFEGFSEKELIF